MSELIGKFHPLIVHLPIGILVLAFIIEIASRNQRFAHLQSALSFVFLITIISALLSLLTGWIMPKEGEFDENLIRLHFWFSVGLTVTTILVYWLHLKKVSKFGKFYFPMLMLTMILLAATGHFGGSLTHGSNHFSISDGDKTLSTITNVDSLFAFQNIIQPIFKKKCVSCHNEGKKKGGLLMTTIEELKKGGDEGAIFVAGDVGNSALIQRIYLPIEDERHMPPEGKKQLTKNEIALLEWWISEGADFNKKVGELPQTEEIKTILKTYEQKKSKIDINKLDVIDGQTISKLEEFGIKIIPIEEKNRLVIASLSRDTFINPNKLKQLKSIAENITELDLSFSNMNDEFMNQLSDFENLKTLKLQNTEITSIGLKHLEQLKNLESLNLYGTKINDAAFENLAKITSLKSLYLWQTEVTAKAVQQFSNQKPLIEISHKIDTDIFGTSQLKPPLITAEKEIFKDTLRVSISLSFKNVDVFYTLDGSMPDSTSSKYEAPFLIDKTTEIKAFTSKKDWITSEVSSRVFIQTGHEIASIKLDKKPNDSYKAKGAKSLIDFEKGTQDFKDGKWLGFYGENVTAILDLGEKKAVNSLVISALEDTGSYIFFPKGVAVSASINGNNYQIVKKIDIPISKENHPSEVKSFLLDFEKTDARFLKVEILGTLKNPTWHPAPGAKSWVFVDEILVN